MNTTRELTQKIESQITRPRLLFTGGGGVGTEALNRLLRSKYEVHFADAELNSKHHTIDQSKWHKLPRASNKSFSEKVLELCEQIKPNLLIPAVDEELLKISKLAKKSNCLILLPTENFILRHLDKLSSNKFLVDAGLPAPRTSRADSFEADFPIILKPRSGRGSRGVKIVHNKKEFEAHLVLSRANEQDFIAQELLLGDEYTVMVSADSNGQVQAIVPVKVHTKRGITIDATTVDDIDVISACRNIHQADPVPGCYNIQLIKEANGTIKPFEINPRISTTACLCFAAGVDFVDIFLGCKKNNQFEQKSLMDFQSGLRLKRSWHNEIYKFDSH